MPRKQFIADFEVARTAQIEHIHDLQRGEEDGQFDFIFNHAHLAKPISVTALIPDLGDYPRTHEYCVFAPDDAPAQLAHVISNDITNTRAKNVSDLLRYIVTAFVRSFKDADGDYHMPNSQTKFDDPLEEFDEEEEDDDDDEDEDDHFCDELVTDEHLFTARSASTGNGMATNSHTTTSPQCQRLKQDLRLLKLAGFKVGGLGLLLEGQNAFLSVSIRIRKLGISREAMQAWQVEPEDYLILLIHYPAGYKCLEQLMGAGARSLIQLRVGASKHYKPSLAEAVAVFNKTSRKQSTTGSTSMDNERETGFRGFHEIFISGPLENLLNERLLPLICYREVGMDWAGAELFYIDTQGTSIAFEEVVSSEYMTPAPTCLHYADIVQADHFAHAEADNISFPLVAMQFLLRHFVRCTEFCLICHRQMSQEIEAIKPYVCDNPLCLYQYMTLGFGPSIEHEIIAQPYVVDLLISFCYQSSFYQKLKDFPIGLSLMVPMPTTMLPQPNSRGGLPSAANILHTDAAGAAGQTIKFDQVRREILFDDPLSTSPVRVGDWVVIRPKHSADVLHYRIVAADFYPCVTLGEAVVPVAPKEITTSASMSMGESNLSTSLAAKPTKVRSATEARWVEASMTVYNQNFDSLDRIAKCTAIKYLLDTLPSIREMQDYLVRHKSMDLRSWSERMSPASLGLLRWIIASNRACIVQDDDLDADTETTKSKHPRLEARVYGMSNWAQFRFAMGAPDKEQRFVKAVKQTAKRLQLEYPTLYAWHGSPLQNWHSIIREGLNFNETAHGRAYGHGCYHSLHLQTSLGYSGFNQYSLGVPTGWPSSILQVTSAIALNEIVNAPDEFVSRAPHLVVSQLDWIQTRYLFVKVSGDVAKLPLDTAPTDVLPQDPRVTPVGESEKVIIPANIGKDRFASKRKKSGSSRMLTKVVKRLKGAGSKGDPINVEEDSCVSGEEDDIDNESQATDTEDLNMLLYDDIKHAKTSSFGVDRADVFRPGTLDHSDLPQMPEPSYANITATKRLQSDFKALLKVQESQPLEELGWYINPEKFDNVYQWIVELHSFEAFRDNGKDIPLVQDMKKQKVKSIVLELRFPGSYPMSPPFVRVIQPRFLGFQQGGGGHVTAGGALCMELLTNSGWSAVSSIESVLLQVRLAIASTDPKPARLEQHSFATVYGVGEAVEAYKRACRAHGWAIPADFSSMVLEGGQEK